MAKNKVNTQATIKDAKGNYASVNGLNLYYEIHGAGEPLILLHGGVGAIQMFGEVLPSLAQDRHPAPGSNEKARSRLDPLQAGWMVPRDTRGNGADGSSGRGAHEADPDVPALCQHRAEAGRLASAAHQ